MSVGGRAVGKECPNDPDCFVGAWPRAPVWHAWSLPSLKWIFTQKLRWAELLSVLPMVCHVYIWPIISQNFLFSSFIIIYSWFLLLLEYRMQLWFEKWLFGKVCLITSALKTLCSTLQSHALSNSPQPCQNCWGLAKTAFWIHFKHQLSWRGNFLI